MSENERDSIADFCKIHLVEIRVSQFRINSKLMRARGKLQTFSDGRARGFKDRKSVV